MTARFLLLLAACLTFPRLALAEDSPSDDSWSWLQQQLATPTSLHVHKMPLDQVLKLLGQQTGVQFVLDTPALDDLGISHDETITVSLDSVSLGTMLELVLRELELTWTLRERVFVITTEEEALRQLHVRVYPVDDLLLVDGDQDYDSLIDVIISTIASDTWVENGGPEAEIRPFPSSNAIVISQTLHEHLAIERLLADIRRIRQRQGLPVIKSSTKVTRPTTPTTPRRTYYQPSASASVPRAYE